MDRLGAEPALGACRTLDALHRATALTLRDHLGPALLLGRFDRELATVGRGLGFVVRGAPELDPGP